MVALLLSALLALSGLTLPTPMSLMSHPPGATDTAGGGPAAGGGGVGQHVK